MHEESYRELFFSESEDYLKNINQAMVKLEAAPGDKASLEEIFRCLHTIKGMSATMGFDNLAKLSHSMESLFDELRQGRIKLTLTITDKLFYCIDIVSQLLEDTKNNQESNVDVNLLTNELKNLSLAGDPNEFFLTPAEKLSISSRPDLEGKFLKIKISLVTDCAMKQVRAFLVLKELSRFGEIIKTVPSQNILEEGKFENNFLVVLVTKEDPENIRQDLMGISEIEFVEAKEMQINSQNAIPGVADKDTGEHYVKKIQSMRIPVKRLDQLMNLVQELVIARIRLAQLRQAQKNPSLDEISFSFDRLVTSLQEEVLATRFLPIAHILDNFPRMVRDLAHNAGKEVNFLISGSEIELDRVILDEIGDPLVHLVRNAIDHGIEIPQVRIKNNKPAAGKVEIRVSRQKGQIFVEVIDDGEGIDTETVKNEAIRKGLLSKDDGQWLEPKKILDILTTSGFSTKKEVTEVSGRGVGLDVVKNRLDMLGGGMDFFSQRNQGSRFVLALPLTVAIIKAMLVKVGDETYAIPLMNIRETIKLKTSEIKFIQHFEVFRIREEVIPIIRLDKELGLDLKNEEKNDIPVVIVEAGMMISGLVVSAVIGEQDIVVKPLGAPLKKTRGISGATILGNGKVALILDAAGIK